MYCLSGYQIWCNRIPLKQSLDHADATCFGIVLSNTIILTHLSVTFTTVQTVVKRF